jgi:YfiR/HmsC-like
MLTRLIWMIVLGAALGAPARAEVDEYQLKAAFLYNFAKFVDWPPEAFTSPSDPFTICVLGENPFGKALAGVIDGRTLNGRSFQLRPIPDAQHGNTCQILFVSSSERNRFRSILGELKASAILTVGDTAGFATAGGVANLTLEGETIRIEINIGVAKQNNLRISSKLLNLARIVK